MSVDNIALVAVPAYPALSSVLDQHVVMENVADSAGFWVVAEGEGHERHHAPSHVAETVLSELAGPAAVELEDAPPRAASEVSAT